MLDKGALPSTVGACSCTNDDLSLNSVSHRRLPELPTSNTRLSAVLLQ